MIQIANYPRSRFLFWNSCCSFSRLWRTSPLHSGAVARHVIIRAGRSLDVKTCNMLTGEAITIEGDKIVSVGPACRHQAASRIRLSSIFRMRPSRPGLIDAHTHLTGDPKDLGYESLGISIPRETLIGRPETRG